MRRNRTVGRPPSGALTVASFELDAYEFIHDGRTVLAGQPTIIPSMGGRWTEPDGSEVACPVTAILAVKRSGATSKAEKVFD